MSRQVDVVQVIRIVIYFVGMLIVVSGIESGLINLIHRAPLQAFPQTCDIILYGVGMILYCPLAFSQAVFGLCCIRYNKQLVRFCESFSRKRSRIGQSAWKSSEIHALLCVFFGMYVLYRGLTDVTDCILLIVDGLCFANKDFTYVVIMTVAIPVALIYYFVPGVLFIRFAPGLTGMIGKRLVK
jgi:hypothetical protein